MSAQTKELRRVIARLEKLATDMEAVEKAEPDPRQGTLTDSFEKFDALFKEETEKPLMGVYI